MGTIHNGLDLGPNYVNLSLEGVPRNACHISPNTCNMLKTCMITTMWLGEKLWIYEMYTNK